MGLRDLFGGSFKKKVDDAVAEVEKLGVGVTGLRAEVDGKVVTLHGTAMDRNAKFSAMEEFGRRVDADNILNRIDLAPEPEASPEPAPAAGSLAAEAPGKMPATERIHEVVSGDTLSGLAKRYYGDARQYMRIFEANRDQLDDPDMIRVGQKLRVP